MGAKRKAGRPKRGQGLKLDHRRLDRLLVQGERDLENKGSVVYPTYSELAERFGVSKGTISHYASKHNCMERRKQTFEELQAKVDAKLVEIRADARALPTAEAVQIIDDYVRLFADRVSSGEVRADSPSDVNTLLRLKEFLLGNADSRTEVTGHISLEAIQSRHKQTVAAIQATTPAIRGVVSQEAEADRVPGPEVEPVPLPVRRASPEPSPAVPKETPQEDPGPAMAAV